MFLLSQSALVLCAHLCLICTADTYWCSMTSSPKWNSLKLLQTGPYERHTQRENKERGPLVRVSLELKSVQCMWRTVRHQNHPIMKRRGGVSPSEIIDVLLQPANKLSSPDFYCLEITRSSLTLFSSDFSPVPHHLPTIRCSDQEKQEQTEIAKEKKLKNCCLAQWRQTFCANPL